MDASDTKSTPSLSFSPPQDKSPSIHGSFKVPRSTTSFKTSNPEIFPSLNPLGGFLNNHKKGGDNVSTSPSEEFQDIPLKKTKSENSTINMLANYGSGIGYLQSAQDPTKLSFMREASQLLMGKEGNKLTASERENIREFMESFYSKETINEEKVKEQTINNSSTQVKVETEKKDNGFPFAFPINSPNQQKVRQQEIFKSVFSGLVHEFEMCWKRQLAGLYELEKWYNTDIPFNSPLSESINLLLVDRLSKKLKVEHESLDLLHKAQNVYEIHHEYKEKYKEFVQTKGIVGNNSNGKLERKNEKARVIVIDGNYDASSSRIGCKRSFQDFEGKETIKEIKESA